MGSYLGTKGVYGQCKRGGRGISFLGNGATSMDIYYTWIDDRLVLFRGSTL